MNTTQSLLMEQVSSLNHVCEDVRKDLKKRVEEIEELQEAAEAAKTQHELVMNK